MRKIINGLNMAYYDTGGNLPVVFLIHGFPLNKDIWQYQISELSGKNRIIAPDLRGHGESQSSPGPNYMDLLADDCAALLQALEIHEPVVVGGLSMGGYNPGILSPKSYTGARFIVICHSRECGSHESQENREQMARLAEEKGAAAIAKVMLPKMLAPKSLEMNPLVVSQLMDIMKSTSAEGIVGDLNGMKTRPDSTQMLPAIDKPTLIVHGIEDRLISITEAETMRALIPNATLHLIESSGHLLNMEQPDIFNRVLSDFLQEV